MDNQIKKALNACVREYAQSEGIESSELLNALVNVFDGDQDFMQKVGNLDRVIDDFPRAEEIREVLFDLLLMNFFAADVAKLENDYLDSPEWEAIEEKTLERGTELLNLLLYIRECADEKIEPELNDFLQEFLLVEEDEFQDEHKIYESIISQPILSESSYLEIGKAAKKLDEDDALVDLFYPILSFFYEAAPNDEDMKEFEQHAPNKSFEKAVYQLLINFNR